MTSRAARVLADADELVRDARRSRPATSTGSSSAPARAASPAIRIGLAAARGLALALDVPVAGVSTLDALAAGAPGRCP